MEYDKLPEQVQLLLNNIDQTRISLKDAVDDAMATARSPAHLVRILSAKGMLDGMIGTLDMVLKELRDPMLVVTGDMETHPCDNCEVVLNNLDANEHCHGCTDEIHLETFVPKDMRNLSYIEPTEVSAEDV